MVRAFGKNKTSGAPIVLLGLSRKNCESLLEGMPVLIDGADYGCPEVGQIVLMAGETEAGIVEKLQEQGLLLDTRVVGEGFN